MSTDLAQRRPFSPEFAGKVTVDRTSMAISSELSFEEWVNLGEQLTEVGDSMAWWVGDWIEQGTVIYGGKYDDAMRVMALEYETLRNYALVARRFSDVSRRRDNLSFGHHQVVSSLVEAEQEAFLDAAVKHQWSVRDLRDAVRDARALPAGGAHIVLERLTITVPEDRAERWKLAADHAGVSVQDWCASVLDQAADIEVVQD